MLDRWLTRFDPGTGLLPELRSSRTASSGRTATPARICIPHLAIAAHLLAPENDPLFTRLLAAERKLGPGVTGRRADSRRPARSASSLKDRIFGNAEYAKDGLLPMVDRLGPDPWLGRLVEVADEIMAASATPTRSHGMVPADSTEVNGDMLQVLARTYWATGDRKYLDAAGRIGRT